ncbi:aminotransferase-like domain-containing protein [Macrococcus capreoli]|uniref:aminotransferase-like domain-containing protein n=1 Tax=Macrococcus capreoli TaxID=2982690 RepID=UPI0021D5EC6C|nr:PLP-dependent aminotransferase family protein [Macrococcus sp. TMW 2.2395]MCU7557990.1 PLP-dependent aminotransferase family protein [Macrococcus sp. TMW 2.2395]
MNKKEEIINAIIDEINNGLFEVGDKLPSQRALADRFNVNRSTIVEALNELKSIGILTTIEKKGIFVSDTINVLVHNHTKWKERIHPHIEKQNQYYIKRINELEFDEGIVRLGTGELSPDLIPVKQFQDIMKGESEPPFTSNYEAPLGNIQLRQAIQKHVIKRGIKCEIDEICVTSGALQGLKLIAEGFLLPSSKIYIESPSYMNSVKTWKTNAATLIPIDIHQLERKLMIEHHNQANSFLYLNPILHNPTGHTYSQEMMERLIKESNLIGLPIIEDDIYSELWFDGVPPLPMKSYQSSNNVVYIGSLSKAVSPGLRIGWVIANRNVVKHLADLKMQSDYGASSIAQYVAANWLLHYHDDHIKQLTEKLKVRSNIMLEALDKYFSDIATWNKPEGSFYIWLKFKKKIDMRDLFETCVKNKLLIHPGEIYDEKQKSSIRLSYAYIDSELIETSLRQIRDIINKITT